MVNTHRIWRSCMILGLHFAASLGIAVQVEGGLVEGKVVEGSASPIRAFQGIPYAAPPVGALRWRAPAPVVPWQGVRRADQYGAACIQPEGLSAQLGVKIGAMSEDCLFLNVWTLRAELGAKLPVIVWIHGGGFVSGAAGADLYDGTSLARKGIVFVGINYRMMQLGFFAHPALGQEDQGISNFGLLDQIAALRWVQKYIGGFGGDAGNVTIIGQSAGAKSVLALFASPLAKGLFHRGVALSNYALPDASQAAARKAAASASEALGLAGERASLEELRAIPAARFGTLNGRGQLVGPVPIQGDKVLPISIEETFEKGQEARLPLMLGNTSDDGSVAFAFGIDPNKLLDQMRGSRFALKILYPKVKEDRELARQATRDLVFTLASRLVADRHSRIAPVYRYYFDYVSPELRGSFPNGVPHGGEIAYFLDSSTLGAAEREQARKVSDFVVAFATSGTPNGTVAWRRHEGRQDWTLLIGEKFEMTKNFWRARLNAMVGGAKILDFFVKR